MFEVLINGQDLYYPSNQEYAIFNTSLQLDVGLAGEFTFDVPVNNPIYEQIGQGLIITILRDRKEFWRGEIKEVKTALNKTKTVYCLEDLAWLADEFMTPASITNESYMQRFITAINTYNVNRPADRQFTVGYLTNVSEGDSCSWNTEYNWSILDSLRNCICKDSGYIKVRRVVSGNSVTRYIDIVKLSDYGVQATQPITFGVNLLNYLQKMDLGNLTNVLTPYGAELEEAEELYPEHAQRLAGTPIENVESIAKYGRHAKAVIFENVTSLTMLNGLAQAYLTRYSNPQLTMEISAVDLAEISNNSHFDIGDSIHIIADTFNIDQWIYLTKQTLDLQDASKNEVTLSSHVSRGASLTDQTVDTAELVRSMPSKQSILDSAKRNSLNMLLDETQGGYIVYEYHETAGKADYIEAINICDEPTIDASLSRWRWSYNGLGFLQRESTSDAWNYANIPIALTNEGEINADRILTGTLDADQVTVHGRIEATSGYIGDESQGWEIGAQDIHNGVTGMDDNSHGGTYIGVDGIRFNQKPTDPSPLAYTKLTRTGIDCQTIIEAQGFYVKRNGSVIAGDGGSVSAANFNAVDSGGGYHAGVSGSIAWVDENQRKTFGLAVTNGIVTYINESSY